MLTPTKSPSFPLSIKSEVHPSLVATTTQPATGVILEKFEEMQAKGFDELLVVTLSQKLSGTYEGCMLAAKMMEDYKITIFDSKSVAFPESRMILDAAEMLESGKSMEEVIKRLEFIRDNSMIWFSVETLKYLVKNGRLSGAAGFVGSHVYDHFSAILPRLKLAF